MKPGDWVLWHASFGNHLCRIVRLTANWLVLEARGVLYLAHPDACELIKVEAVMDKKPKDDKKNMKKKKAKDCK